jgi:hypothetical protein
VDHQRGGSSIFTQTDCAPLSFIFGLANGLTRPFGSWDIPTKNMQRVWHREYLQYLDLRIQPAAQAPMYSESEKQAALAHCRPMNVASLRR